MRSALPSGTDAPFGSARGAYRWWLIGLLWMICFANYADRQAVFSVFPPLKSEFSLSLLDLGVIGSAFMWTYAGFGPLAGWLCDRVSRRRVIVSALLFWSACTTATAIARSYHELVACRALGGLGEAFYFPAAMSMIADYHGGATRSRAMALHQSAVYAGSIAGGGLAAWLAQRAGWRQPFVYFGAFGLVLSLVLLALLREPVRGASTQDASLPLAASGSFVEGMLALLANPAALALAAAFAGANFVAAIFLSWTPDFLFVRFHMSLASAGLNGSAWLQLFSILGVIAGGVLADRLARRRPGGRVLAQATGLLAGTPFLFLIGWARAVGVAVVAMCAFGLAKGIYDANIFSSLYDVVPVRHRGATAGLMNSLGWLGGGAATIAVASAIPRFGSGACLSATSAIYAVLGCGLLVLSRLLHRKRENITA